MTPLRDAAESATAGVPVAPERIWATVNGASTRLPDGVRQFIGGWSEDPTRPRAVEYVKASALDTARAEIERLTKALKPFADTFRQHNDPGVSDLYNEQPVAWHVPLGAYRVTATLSPAVKEPK